MTVASAPTPMSQGRPALNRSDDPAARGIDSEETVGSVDAVAAWVRRHRITALLVEVSSITPGIRAAARRAGLSVPQDLSLVALGGSPEAPGMSSIADLVIPRQEMGAEAVRLLLRLLDTPDSAPLHSTLTCGLRPARTLADAPGG